MAQWSTFRLEDKHALLTYSLVELGVERSDQIYACAIAVGQNIMRGLYGQQWRATTVTFPFRRPSNTEPYRAFFGAPPRFNEVEAGLVFPARQLGTPLSGADPFLNALMLQRITAASHAAKGDLVEQLRRLLRAQVTTSGTSLREAASALGVAQRTLNRQLTQQHQTNFRKVRDDLWYELARKRLAQSLAPIGEIGSMLGYSDPAAFTRAFKRWSGITPIQWRRRRLKSRSR